MLSVWNKNKELVLDGDLISGTAYSHGLKHASGNFVVIMDADLSHHVSVFHMVWMVIWDNVEDLGLDHGETIPSGENLG